MKYTGYVYYQMPDGSVKELSRVDDVLGERKTTYMVGEEELNKYRKEICDGIGKRMSTYYNSQEYLDSHPDDA